MASLTAQAQIQIQKAKIPRILLGTSPFIGAGQFGPRAYTYYSQFYEHPENIVKIISKSFDLGIRGIHLLPYPPVVEAVKSAERNLKLELNIFGTIRFESPESDIQVLQSLRATAMLIHGEITDLHKEKEINELLNQIRQAGSVAGIVTHKPYSTLQWLQKTELDPDIIMLPFNKLGKFMDSAPEKVLEAAQKLGKTLIGKKALAAGRLTPREGLEFVLQKGIKIVAIGVASEAEANETFSIANELLSLYR